MLADAHDSVLNEALQEASYYHRISEWGTFAILRYDPSLGKKVQTTYPLKELAKVVNELDVTQDTWISQGEFRRFNRRIVNLLRMGVFFSDLDTYNTPYESYSPETLAHIVINRCSDEGIPTPSVILFSGRGLQLKWLLTDPIPKAALPRWNAVQRTIRGLLSDLGADSQAVDASRVLRLAGTMNSKSKEYARVVYVDGSLESPTAYDFDWFADEVLPFTRDQIRQFREARKKEDRATKKPHLKMIKGGRKQGDPEKLNEFRIAWLRYNDLERLAQIRGGCQEGERMNQLMWQLNFMFLSYQIEPSNIWYESMSLAKNIDPNWPVNLQDLSSLYKKAQAFFAGQKIEFKGREYPPLYTPKNQTLIEIFKITPEEERQLRTVISKSEVQRRNTESKRAARREAGAMERSEYLANAQHRREVAQQLRANGMKMKDIAEKLGMHPKSLSRLIKS